MPLVRKITHALGKEINSLTPAELSTLRKTLEESFDNLKTIRTSTGEVEAAVADLERVMRANRAVFTNP